MAKKEDGKDNGRFTRKDYEKEMGRLHVELCKLQDWVKYKGLRVIVVFEGRDAAGKGGTICALTERVSPRVFRVVALPAPSDREKGQAYVQRYVQHFPAAGEIVVFDRSWYNRAGVEHVMGFCTPEEHRKFLEHCPTIEKYFVDGGIILIKYWMEVGKKEQQRRFEARIDDPLRQWKLSPMDLESFRRWYEYSRARQNVGGYRQQACALVHRSLGRQQESPAELYFPFLEHDSIWQSSAGKSKAAQAQEEKQLRRSGLTEGKALRSGEILSPAKEKAGQIS